MCLLCCCINKKLEALLSWYTHLHHTSGGHCTTGAEATIMGVANNCTGAAQGAVKKQMQKKTSAERLQEMVTYSLYLCRVSMHISLKAVLDLGLGSIYSAVRLLWNPWHIWFAGG